MYKKRVRVLHFVSQGNIGGQERALYQLIKALSKDGDVQLAVAFVQEEGIYVDKIKELGIPVISLKVKSGFTLRFNKKVMDQLKEFDIHHLHDPSPNIMIYSILAGPKIHRVFTRRGGMAEYSLFNQKKRIKFSVKKFLAKKFIDGFSGNSANAVKSLKEQYKVKEKVSLLYNGIYFNLLKPSGSKQKLLNDLCLNNSFVIGSVGRLVKLKRIDLLIRCFANTDIAKKKLLIIGTGVEINNLKSLARNLNIENDVLFTGAVENIQDYFQLIDCFVLPSNNRESFGNAVVEAMYFKIPSIIMNDSDGLKEHIIHGETGLIAKNEDELASHIEFIYNHRDKGKEIGENAHQYVTNKYSVENMIRVYKNFYAEVLNFRGDRQLN